MELLREALPACQPQEGSPANTFTDSELKELQAALPQMNIRPGETVKKPPAVEQMNICNAWEAPTTTVLDKQEESPNEAPSRDWHGAPRFPPTAQLPRDFRNLCRQGLFTGPTNAQCPGFLQCNLVVLPSGPIAFDFLLFCQRNPQSCPLIEVCDVGSTCPFGVAEGADLRTDVPK